MQSSIALEQPQTQELGYKAASPSPRDSRSWLWLAVAVILLVFANGVDSIPLAAWLAPLFLLRFVRTQSLKVGLPVAYVVLIATFPIQFRGMVPIPGIAYYIFLLVNGIPAVLPYVLDRLLTRRLTGLRATLVFPGAWAATEYLTSLAQYGSDRPPMPCSGICRCSSSCRSPGCGASRFCWAGLLLPAICCGKKDSLRRERDAEPGRASEPSRRCYSWAACAWRCFRQVLKPCEWPRFPTGL
jgi:hypothetical protein